MSNVNVLTDEHYASAISYQDAPVLVYFWAEWCGPCVRLGPIVEAVAEEYGPGNIIVNKINADQNPKATTSNNILGLPTIFIYKKGELVKLFTGNITKRNLVKAIEEVIAL